LLAVSHSVAPGLGQKRSSIKVCCLTLFKFRIADELEACSKVLSPLSTQLRKKTRVESMVTPVAFKYLKHYLVYIIIFFNYNRQRQKIFLFLFSFPQTF
jgi:hypothetical protein